MQITLDHEPWLADHAGGIEERWGKIAVMLDIDEMTSVACQSVVEGVMQHVGSGKDVCDVVHGPLTEVGIDWTSANSSDSVSSLVSHRSGV